MSTMIAKGFSLIEMMVSITIGLIVAAGAVSLIVAIDQSNSETIQSTRLTQELRTLATVIADDIKRTRRIDDPVAFVGQGTAASCPTLTTPVTPAQPCYPIQTHILAPNSPTAPSCLTYGYSGTIADQTIYNYRSVRLAGNTLIMDQLTFDPNGVAAGTALPTTTVITHCNPAGGITGAVSYPLNAADANDSSVTQLKITSFCVSQSADGGSCYFDTSTDPGTCTLNTVAPASGEIDVCIAGQMQAGDVYSKTITRAFVQPIYVRSGPAG